MEVSGLVRKSVQVLTIVFISVCFVSFPSFAAQNIDPSVLKLPALEQESIAADLTNKQILSIANFHSLPAGGPLISAKEERRQEIIRLHHQFLLRSPDRHALEEMTGSEKEIEEIKAEILKTREAKFLRNRLISKWCQDFLNKRPRGKEIKIWAESELTFPEIFSGILKSEESLRLRKKLVTELYQTYLNRTASEKETQMWVKSDLTLNELRKSILHSTEAAKIRRKFIKDLYLQYGLPRPSESIIRAWLDQDKTPEDIELRIRNGFGPDNENFSPQIPTDFNREKTEKGWN